MADSYSQHPGSIGLWHKVKAITPRGGNQTNLVESQCGFRFPEKSTVTVLPEGAETCERPGCKSL